MRSTIVAAIAICCAAVTPVHADPAMASVQQALKEQGFYYGEITGTKDADTTAAIRRYQIRNGLQITGELNAETQKSLGIRGGLPTPAPASPHVLRTPTPAPHTVAPDTSDLRDDFPVATPPPAVPRQPSLGPGAPQPGFAPDPRAFNPAMSGVFDGTPFEVATPDVQHRVLLSAQALLARQGYYRSAIDGEYGPGTEFALRAYQTRFGLPSSGRLDMETLATLGLLPGQRAPGMQPPRRRIYRPTPLPPYPGERIYIPR